MQASQKTPTPRISSIRFTLFHAKYATCGVGTLCVVCVKSPLSDLLRLYKILAPSAMTAIARQGAGLNETILGLQVK